ncbi:MAG: hypothetical protein MJ185_08910 [Treponema sp.]|nr:hypothetical protein [Treponema sp.]
MKKLVGIILGAAMCASAFAIDVTLRATPGIMLPLGKDPKTEKKYYETGIGIFAQADVDLFGFMTAGVEGNFASLPANGLDKPIQLLGGGLGLGAYYYPLSRLYTGLGGSFGIYQLGAKLDGESSNGMGLYYRGYGEIGFRVNPEFTVAVTGGYMSHMIVNDKPLVNSPNAGISLRYTVPLGKSGSSSFGVNFVQEDAAQPLFMSAYRVCPLGTLTLTNSEGAEVRNVHVSFRAGKYTSSTFESAQVSRINKYASVEIPLYADFSQEILKFSENGKISGELVVEYEFLGKKKQAVQNVVLSVYNRNAFYWTDPTSIAAFVSPNTPEVLTFAKYVAGIVNKQAYTGMNKAIQTAAGMVEGLRLSGIRYSDDKITPYEKFHLDYELDSVQYPLQTMNCLSGDYDDLGILLASCLESVGISTGFLPVNDDFIVLVDMGVSPNSAASHIADTESLFYTDDSAWFGLSMKELTKGFAASHIAGSKAIMAAMNDEENYYEVVLNEQSWETYAPATFTGSGNEFENPRTSVLEESIKASIKGYIASDLEPIIAKHRKDGNTHQLGLALVRAGRYSEAKAEFSKLNTAAAMNNTANILMLEHKYSECAAMYKKVLEKDPENKTAKRGLERVNEKLGL